MKECSVIIPVYNCDRNVFLRCIERLSPLDHGRYEVIVVDDGSDEDITSFLPDDGFVRCIRQEHAGVSAARNRGIVQAEGSRIVFCDADDLIDADALDECISGLTDAQDFVYAGYTKRKNGRDEEFRPEAGLGPEAYLKKLLCEPNLYGTVWGKVYRRELMIGKQLLFDPGLTHAEDTEFLIRYLNASETTVCSVPFYTYLAGTSSSAKRNRQAVNSYLRALHRCRDLMERTSVKEYVYNLCCVNLLIMAVNYIFPAGTSYKEGKEVLKTVLADDLIQTSLTSYVKEEMSVRNRAVLRLLKNRLYYAVFVIAGIRRNM